MRRRGSEIAAGGKQRIMPIRVPSFMSDNMVMQQGMAAALWGWAEVGETITVSLGNQTASCQAGGDGKWLVRLEAMEAGGPYEMSISGAKGGMEIENVAVGEVWLASGQSNMQWVVADCYDAESEIAASDYPMIREFTAERISRSEPQEDVNGEWQGAGPESVGQFSAVGYYFARHLHKELGVPVGILNSSWGGSMCKTWVRREDLEADVDFAAYAENVAQAIEDYPALQQEAEKLLADHYVMREKALAEGTALPAWPELPGGYPTRAATGLYNGMLHPLVPYTMRGAIWYQGESDARSDMVGTYRKLCATMVTGWRQAWGQGDFPFLFVQLANYNAENYWPLLREAQLQMLSLRNTGMAVAIDVGDAEDIHPKNKQAVGYRLGLAARALAYGEELAHSGPIYREMRVAESRARLSFEHTGGGLVSKRNEALTGFVVAGDDGVFVVAEAEIDGDEVVVWSEQVARPVAVRYGWANNPDCSLYNAEGLPASPFRTDDWEPEQ